MDFDFVLVELPVAVVEYKHHAAQSVSVDHPSYWRWLSWPASCRSGSPATGPTRGRPEVTPADQAARRWFPEPTDLSEAEWVAAMHDLRAKTVQDTVGRDLGWEKPPAAA